MGTLPSCYVSHRHWRGSTSSFAAAFAKAGDRRIHCATARISASDQAIGVLRNLPPPTRAAKDRTSNQPGDGYGKPGDENHRCQENQAED
jgi:hypothetical protein